MEDKVKKVFLIFVLSMVLFLGDYTQVYAQDNQPEIIKDMIDGEENLRQVGFKLTNTDVETGIFNDIFLHSLSSKHQIFISGVPRNEIDEVNGGHIASCGLCDYSVYEDHNLRLENNTEYCTKCDYSISLGLRYISNGDGRTHTRISDTGSRVENCVGIINETGNICCTKCGQVLNTGSGGIIRPNKKEEIAVLLKKRRKINIL